MYGIFTYIWLILMVNVGKYTIHGSYGIVTTLGYLSEHISDVYNSYGLKKNPSSLHFPEVH